ncbi:universal stress protein [Mucilaginibacter sp. UR6-11]|uniref:universal stress protein n=1 Tax=Mucilaginibacter sp. UR6-11 TaxID=1435644 RepID=UPI001E4B30A0|nr:universal stress protein [Mucilaginibacter sp. UR6-11]MCC8425508.1 universal stress protein [Mucilaginibacter sp. UR6-11]
MKNILVLTDFSASAARAAECALGIAAKLGADVLLVNVYPITPYLPSVGLTVLPLSTPGEKRRESTTRLNREVRRLEKRLQDLTVPGHKPDIRPIPLEGLLAERVSQLVRRKNCIMITMGVSAQSYGDLFFDGNIKAVLQLAVRPVLIIPATWNRREIRHILFATDLAEEDQKVLNELISLCNRLKVQISVTHVSRPVLIPDFAEEIRVSAFIEKITSLNPAIRYYPARGANTLAALKKTSEDQQTDLIALRYQKHPGFYHLFHENPLKEAIKLGTLPLLIFPETSHGHD